MGPVALAVYGRAGPSLKAMLAEAQHWFIDETFYRSLSKLTESAHDARIATSPDVYVELAMPGPAVVLELYNRLYFYQDAGNGRVHVFVASATRKFTHIYTANRRETSVVVTTGLVEFPSEVQDNLWNEFLMADFFFSIIAEPRLVKIGKAPRPFRRSSERTLGFTVAAWHSVSWTVGRPASAKVASGDLNHGLPLHVVRAHWRYFDRQTENSEVRFGTKGRGHYVWVKHHFKGHPDFGIKLHHYQPKFGKETERVLNVTLKNATEAAQKALLEKWKVT